MAVVSLEERRRQATDLVAEILALKNTLDSILKDANSLLSGITTNDKVYKSLIEKLDAINKETVTAVAGFKGDRTKITKLLVEAEKFYKEKYAPLALKYAAKKKEFAADVVSAGKELKKFEKLKSDCAAQYDQIVALCKSFKARTVELKKIDDTIHSLQRSSEQNKGKIDKLYEIVSSAHKEILTRNANIKQLEAECNILTKKIQKFAQESDENNQKINELHHISAATLADIRQIYNIASETGLSGEFENRRNTLNKEIRKWGRYVLGTSLVLFVGIIILFCVQLHLNDNKLDSTFDLNFYIRFLIDIYIL